MSGLRFEVVGVPMPQGSMKAFNAGGRAMMKPSGGNKFAQWRNAVSQAARDHTANDQAWVWPLDGPLALKILFRFPMPASRSKTERAQGEIWKTKAPDIDKLVRCVADALVAAAVIADDARIVMLTAYKFETTGWTGAEITVETAKAIV